MNKIPNLFYNILYRFVLKINIIGITVFLIIKYYQIEFKIENFLENNNLLCVHYYYLNNKIISNIEVLSF